MATPFEQAAAEREEDVEGIRGIPGPRPGERFLGLEHEGHRSGESPLESAHDRGDEIVPGPQTALAELVEDTAADLDDLDLGRAAALVRERSFAGGRSFGEEAVQRNHLLGRIRSAIHRFGALYQDAQGYRPLARKKKCFPDAPGAIPIEGARDGQAPRSRCAPPGQGLGERIGMGERVECR